MDSNCTESVVYRLHSGNTKCECGVGCLDRHYVKQVSTATWPSHQYLVSFHYIAKPLEIATYRYTQSD